MRHFALLLTALFTIAFVTGLAIEATSWSLGTTVLVGFGGIAILTLAGLAIAILFRHRHRVTLRAPVLSR